MRMLDANGYPHSYIKLNKYNFSFNSIQMKKNVIYGKVKIKKK
jgi:hypothetical protein